MWLAAAMGALLGAFPAAAGSDMLPLHGVHRFAPGDDPSWARPDLDDSDWQPIQLPGSAEAQGLAPADGWGWLRIPFRVPYALAGRDLALGLGVVWGADEIFVDGMRIARHGALGAKPALPYLVERVVPLPDAVVRPGRSQLLAIRIQNGFDVWGLLNGPMRIGPQAALLTDAARRERIWYALDGLLIAVNLAGLVAWMLFWRSGRHDTGLVYLGLGLLFLLLVSAGGSYPIFQAGLFTPAVFRGVVVGHQLGGCLAGAAAIHLISDRSLRWLDGVFAIFAAGWFIWFAWPALSWQRAMSEVSFVVGGGLVVLLVIEAVRARRRRDEQSGLQLMASLCYAGLGTITLLALRRQSPADWEMRYAALPFIWILPLFLMIQIGLGMTRTKDRLIRLSSQVLAAQSEERQRLARELHDGVAQDLQAARLALQVATEPGSGARSNEIRHATTMVSQSIEALRGVAQDLRPLGWRSHSLQEALAQYTEILSGRSSVAIRFEDRSGSASLPADMEEHLYRIVQEAIGNALRHASPDLVEIALTREPKTLRLRIVDNGCGFREGSLGDRPHGIGLSTMRERAALIGGACSVESSPDGTLVEVRIPLRETSDV